MKLIFNHDSSIFSDDKPLIFLKVKREDETSQFMLENGWIPFYENDEEYWYQTKSARLKINPISKKRKSELNKLKISKSCQNLFVNCPIDLKYYNHGNFEDFYFDDIFWGRVHFFENQVLYSSMNKTKDKKSYGTLSYYYLIDKFLDKFDYLYITDYFEQFSYKKNLPGFEYWDGTNWNPQRYNIK